MILDLGMSLLSNSHTLCIGFHYETYIGIGPYRSLAVDWEQCLVGYVMCDLIVWENTNVVHFSCDICENTAHVQWIRCSPKGSHLIHWTSAVFSHIPLKWTLYANLIPFWRCLFFITINILKLEIVLANPASNDWKIKTNNSAAQ